MHKLPSLLRGRRGSQEHNEISDTGGQHVRHPSGDHTSEPPRHTDKLEPGTETHTRRNNGKAVVELDFTRSHRRRNSEIDAEPYLPITNQPNRKKRRTHKYSEKRLEGPTFCDHCASFIGGAGGVALCCENCNYTLHEHCLEKAKQQRYCSRYWRSYPLYLEALDDNVDRSPVDTANATAPTSTTATAAVPPLQPSPLSFPGTIPPFGELREKDVLRLTLCEHSVRFCSYLQSYFWRHPLVHHIHNGSFRQLDGKFDCLVLTGNAFGLLDGGDAPFSEVVEVFGEELFTKIHRKISDDYMGELPVGTCVLLRTGNPHFRYVGYVASSFANRLQSPYDTTWALLSALFRHNRSNAGPPIRHVVTYAFWRDPDSYMLAARQMWLACSLYCRKIVRLPAPAPAAAAAADAPPADDSMSPRGTGSAKISRESTREWNAAVNREQDIYRTDPQAERLVARYYVAFFIERLMAGDVTRGGFLDGENLQLLVLLAKSDKVASDVRRTALRTLVTFGWPAERHAGVRKLVLQEGLLGPVLEGAIACQWAVHTEIDKTELIIKDRLTSGASAAVLLAVWRRAAPAEEAAANQTQDAPRVDEVPVVVKRFFSEDVAFSMAEFRKEVAINSLLQHPNLVRFYGAGTGQRRQAAGSSDAIDNCSSDDSTEDSYFLVTEVMQGNLYDLLHSPTPLAWQAKHRMMKDIAKAMNFLHSFNIVHRDLKSLNVLVSDKHRCKLTDFGTSRIVESEGIMTANVGTVSWIAPEVMESKKYDESADVFSFGIILWEIASRKIPFDGYQVWMISKAIIKGERPPLARSWPPELCKLIKRCWNHKPHKRPSFFWVLSELRRLGKNVKYWEEETVTA